MIIVVPRRLPPWRAAQGDNKGTTMNKPYEVQFTAAIKVKGAATIGARSLDDAWNVAAEQLEEQMAVDFTLYQSEIEARSTEIEVDVLQVDPTGG